MKKLLSALFAVVFVIAALTSCSNDTLGESLAQRVKPDDKASYNFNVTETSSPTSYESYRTAAMNFSINMLKILKQAAYSPMALYYQLSMLQNAASGDTRSSIKHLTGDSLSLDELNECNGYFFSRLEALGNKKTSAYIDINGSFLFNETAPVSQSFLLTNADFYNQDVFRLDFSSDDFTAKVNSYLSEKTNGDASYNKTPDKSPDILLLNSAFMRDSWLRGYKNGDIITDVFKGSDKAVKKNFLKSTEFYIEDKNCTGFIKDFKDTPAKFIALLPKKGNVGSFLEKFNSDSYYALLDSMKVTKTCTAYIPEFAQKSTISFINNKKLSFLGEKGSYTPLSYNAKLKVSDIAQSFNININRKGLGNVKAVSSKSEKIKAKKEVKLNRPFIYLIVDNESRLPIFMGTADKI